MTRGMCPAAMLEFVGRQETSAHQRPASLEIPALADFEDDVWSGAGQFPGKQPLAPDTADFCHRALRAPVFLADPENDGIDEGECVVEHQPFDFAVGRSAPWLRTIKVQPISISPSSAS